MMMIKSSKGITIYILCMDLSLKYNITIYSSMTSYAILIKLRIFCVHDTCSVITHNYISLLFINSLVNTNKFLFNISR